MERREMKSGEKKGTRLNKYLAESGICSRRDADRLIEEGRVTVDRRTARLGDIVTGQETIMVNGKPVRGKDDKVVLAYYKPLGVTCTEKDVHAEKTVKDALSYPVRVTYAGRLDRDSEGLLIMTNDGGLIHAMMQGEGGHEREYIVKVDQELREQHLWMMAEGVYLEELDRRTRPCVVEKLGKYTFRIVLTQGLNRQIRRMCKKFRYRVLSLKRVRVMNIELGEMKPGSCREITGRELKELYRQAGL